MEQFRFREETEVLYDVSVVSRYFMRPYPKDLSEFRTMRELLAASWVETEVGADPGVDLGVGAGADSCAEAGTPGGVETGDSARTGDNRESTTSRRHRIYRQLFLCPVLYGNGSSGSPDPDIVYLRNYRNRIQEDIEAHTDFRLELYRNCAMLVLPERKMRYTTYPDVKGISDISLQFAAIVREALTAGEVEMQPDGTIRLTRVDFEHFVSVCKSRYGLGWGVQHRRARLPEVASELNAFLVEWQLARAANGRLSPGRKGSCGSGRTHRVSVPRVQALQHASVHDDGHWAQGQARGGHGLLGFRDPRQPSRRSRRTHSARVHGTRQQVRLRVRYS